jgi:hypothetical protein
MPSDSMGVFTWLYSKAMPALLGSSFLKETMLSLTDGNRNEYQPLEVQIVAGTISLSQHALCGFHLMDRSIVSNPFGKPGAKKEMVFQAITRHMKNWLYSWMRTLESSKEYKTSKKLLVKWLKLDTVVEATTPHIAKNMIDWLAIEDIFLYQQNCYRRFSEPTVNIAILLLK